MLGFILSKMQMLLFAVGIALVAFLFYDFVSRIGLAQSASNLLLTNTRVVSDQFGDDLFCSMKVSTLPDKLTYGFDSKPFFYELGFSKQTFGGGGTTQANQLILSLYEHPYSKPNAVNPTPPKRNLISARAVASEATFVLVKPDFVLEDAPIVASYADGTVNEIALYPRAASASIAEVSAPNSYVALKEVKLGATTMYIIPCTTHKPNNCFLNVIHLGCYLLSTKTPSASDLVPSCFNLTTQATDFNFAVNGANVVSNSLNYNWCDCQNMFASDFGGGAANVSCH